MVGGSSANALPAAIVRIVLDTNVLLTSLGRTSPARPIFDALRTGRVALAVTTDILLEYAEIIERETTPAISANVVSLLLNLPKTVRVEVSYRLNLIHADQDDDKFADCAFAANADWIVTNDKHFQLLASVDFPQLNVISEQEFVRLLQSISSSV